MDDYTTKHLQAWADDVLCTEDVDSVVRKITAHVEQHPCLLEHSYTWHEILAIVERNEKLGIS